MPSLNFDKELSQKAMEEQAQFMKANKAALWIQRDLEQNAKIRLAPKYYE